MLPGGDILGQWADNRLKKRRKRITRPEEDSFLSSLGFKDDQNAELPASDAMFAQWDDQNQAETPLDDDFFASLNPDTDGHDA